MKDFWKNYSSLIYAVLAGWCIQSVVYSATVGAWRVFFLGLVVLALMAFLAIKGHKDLIDHQDQMFLTILLMSAVVGKCRREDTEEAILEYPTEVQAFIKASLARCGVEIEKEEENDV